MLSILETQLFHSNKITLLLICNNETAVTNIQHNCGRNKTAVIKLTDTINVRYKTTSHNNIKSNSIKSCTKIYFSVH